jgi:trk system potassium uptake protein TrkH
MSAFDAFGHAFSTVAIGGFSTHDASMGYFKNDAILWISSLFMLISAINFGLHFFAWKHKSLSGYYRDPETGFYLVCIFVSVSITCVYLLTTQTLTNNEALVHGVFQAISMATTTGFTTTDFASWPTFLPVMLIFFSFIGGCVGSTGGGLKVMRVLLIFKQGLREMKQLVHPQAIIPLRVGGRRVDASIISAVWSFFAVYVSAFLVILLVLMATGLDYLTAFSAVAAMLNNLGPGLGEVASNYASVSDETKWILCFTMLLGRLEVFTLLVLLTPMFWRR